MESIDDAKQPGDGIGNVSTTENIVLQHYSLHQLYGLRAATLLLAITGLIGNLLVVLVILSRRRWRFANSMFVLNIAIANLFICAFTLPLMTRALFDIDWSPADQFCQLSGFLDNTAFACSAWSLALGSIERFILVVFPTRHRQLLKYQRAVMLSMATWIFSVVLSILPILGWNKYRYSHLTFTCGIDTSSKGVHLYYFLVYLACVLPGPLIISTVSYTYILFYLRSELWKSPKRRSKNIKVVLPMILISIAFLLCFLPTVIIGFDITINPGPENGQPRLAMIEYFVINLFLLGSSAMNPIIFTMCSSKFRDSIRIVLQILCERIVLVLFYLMYVVYYGIITFFKAIGHSCSSTYTRLLSSSAAVNCVRCLRHHKIKKYNSLNEVVIKITLTNSNINSTPVPHNNHDAAAQTPRGSKYQEIPHDDYYNADHDVVIRQDQCEGHGLLCGCCLVDEDGQVTREELVDKFNSVHPDIEVDKRTVEDETSETVV